MSAQGTAVVDFGAGSLDTSVAVVGQSSITSANLVEAWANTTATTNNLNDSILAEEIQFYAGDIVVGVGFTIYAMCRSGSAFGKYNVNWVWN